LSEIIKIKPQYISQGFVKSNEMVNDGQKVPQTLVLCKDCGLVQLRETVNPNILYKQYFYRSAVSDTMRYELSLVVKDVISRVHLNNDDIVIDIGANDGTMISYFPENLKRIGVEPAENIDWNNLNKSITIVNNFYTKKNIEKVLNNKKVKVYTCCAMFYDLDDPNAFVKDIKETLDIDGIWCIQLSYLVSMLKNVNFYDICNEHLEYYSISVLKTLMERNGLKIIDASLNGVNGGSARVFVVHEENSQHESTELKKLYEEEYLMNLTSEETYSEYVKVIELFKDKVNCVINEELNKGNIVIGLGASTKGNMLLQTFDIETDRIKYISERNPDKVGMRTLGTDFELISESSAREMNPSMMLVLPWYFKKEIVEREMEYIMNGGKLLIPMPTPHIVTKSGEIFL
jgi:hypothetical protein